MWPRKNWAQDSEMSAKTWVLDNTCCTIVFFTALIHCTTAAEKEFSRKEVVRTKKIGL